MNMDISEEAKQGLANRAQMKARARLVRDGCHTDAAMRRRLLALTTERNLPPAEYAKLLHKRIMTKSITDFCEKHNVSMDWLIYGDLKGLKRTAEWKKQELCSVATTREMARAQQQEYARLYCELSNDAVPIALAFLRNLATKGGNTSA
jgi:hypothetical protein